MGVPGRSPGGNTPNDYCRVPHAVTRSGHERNQVIGERSRPAVRGSIVHAKADDQEVHRFRHDAGQEPLQCVPDGCSRKSVCTPGAGSTGNARQRSGSYGGDGLVATRETDAGN
jgi:hypothetical protein